MEAPARGRWHAPEKHVYSLYVPPDRYTTISYTEYIQQPSYKANETIKHRKNTCDEPKTTPNTKNLMPRLAVSHLKTRCHHQNLKSTNQTKVQNLKSKNQSKNSKTKTQQPPCWKHTNSSCPKGSARVNRYAQYYAIAKPRVLQHASQCLLHGN